ncbi:MAG: sensor histidine kinase [Magnetococcales bacterium]|nr:sensor histidine kinase [Magnetococcales bacterium]
MTSLRTRLTLQQLTLLAVAFLALGLLVTQSTRLLSEHYISDRLEQDIESLLTELSLDEQDRIQLDDRKVDAVFHHTFSGHYFQIVLRDGGTVVQQRQSLSLGTNGLPLPEIEAVGDEHLFMTGPNQKPLMVLVKVMRIREYSLMIAVAEDMTAFLRSFYEFQMHYLVASGVFFLLLAVAQLVVIRRGFRTLLHPLAELQAIESGERSRLSQTVPPEVQPLVVAINRMVERSERRLERSRNALGNLSHTLKIPVSAVSQLGQRQEMETLPEIRVLLLENVAVMQRLIEHELKRARLADPAQPGSLFCLSREIPPLIRTLKSIYYHKSLVIDCHLADDITCRGDREDMIELLGGLLDNACKWADSRVVLRLERCQQQLRIIIGDDGPGCSEGVLQCLDAGGTRLDESGHGYGLGLIISREIVIEYGGSIHFGSSPELGGFEVTVLLPLLPQSGGIFHA